MAFVNGAFGKKGERGRRHRSLTPYPSTQRGGGGGVGKAGVTARMDGWAVWGTAFNDNLKKTSL